MEVRIQAVSDDSFIFRIAEGTGVKGNFRITEDPSRSQVIWGYSGEVGVTIHLSGMQSGICDVVLVAWEVDSFMKVRHFTVPFGAIHHYDSESHIHRIERAVNNELAVL